MLSKSQIASKQLNVVATSQSIYNIQKCSYENFIVKICCGCNILEDMQHFRTAVLRILQDTNLLLDLFLELFDLLLLGIDLGLDYFYVCSLGLQGISSLFHWSMFLLTTSLQLANYYYTPLNYSKFSLKYKKLQYLNQNHILYV